MSEREKGKGRRDTVAKGVRITPECARLWEALARSMGISLTAALEVIIRDRAKDEGIPALPAENAP